MTRCRRSLHDSHFGPPCSAGSPADDAGARWSSRRWRTPAVADDLKGFAARLDRFVDDLTREAVKESLAMLGREATRDAAKALVADIGDTSMSGWPRRSPFDLSIRSEVQVSEGGVLVEPFRRAKGPWRVLNDGRQTYRAGDRRQSGTRARKRDGVTVAKFRKVKRNVGSVDAKNTWREAVEIMVREAPKREHRVVQSVLAKHFKG